MAVDVVGEVVGALVEAVCDLVFHGARGWNLFWRAVIVFVIIPVVVIGLYYLLT